MKKTQVYGSVQSGGAVQSEGGEMKTFGLAACNRALNYQEKLFWFQVLLSPATARTKNQTTKSEDGMLSKFAVSA